MAAVAVTAVGVEVELVDAATPAGTARRHGRGSLPLTKVEREHR